MLFRDLNAKSNIAIKTLIQKARDESELIYLEYDGMIKYHGGEPDLHQEKSISILLIDHEDSFTYNIKAWLEKETGVWVKVIGWDNPELSLAFCAQFQCVVFSPGPGHPSDYPMSRELMNSLPDDFPVLGICLGMQMMIHCSGGEVKPVQPMHGKATKISFNGHELFKGIGHAMIGRYHSLAVRKVPADFKVLARSSDGSVMVLTKHLKKRIGFQFHPESFLTSCGDLLRANLLEWVSQ